MSALKPQDITLYYRWLLDREPEPQILAHYETIGIRRLQLISMIVASEEFTERMRRAGALNPADAPSIPEETPSPR